MPAQHTQTQTGISTNLYLDGGGGGGNEPSLSGARFLNMMWRRRQGRKKLAVCSASFSCVFWGRPERPCHLNNYLNKPICLHDFGHRQIFASPRSGLRNQRDGVKWQIILIRIKERGYLEIYHSYLSLKRLICMILTSGLRHTLGEERDGKSWSSGIQIGSVSEQRSRILDVWFNNACFWSWLTSTYMEIVPYWVVNRCHNSWKFEPCKHIAGLCGFAAWRCWSLLELISCLVVSRYWNSRIFVCSFIYIQTVKLQYNLI